MNDTQILGNGTLAKALVYHVDHLLPEDIFICAWDTPILDSGKPNTSFVIEELKKFLGATDDKLTIVIMSQLPVGTCKKFEDLYPHHTFVVSPENVRAAHAVEDFAEQSRIVLGSRHISEADKIAKIFSPFTSEFIITDPETAEMVKHGLNGFLALSIAYSHELSDIALTNGANPEVLAAAIMADARIGKKAYLKPSGGLGAHLTREIYNLLDLGGGDLIKAIAKNHI